MPRGDIVRVDFGAPVGHEQAGQRPALVVHDDDGTNVSIITIIPFTSNSSAMRFPHTIQIKSSPQNGLQTDSILLVFQLRAIDRSRVAGKLGRLEEEIQQLVDSEIRLMLGL